MKKLLSLSDFLAITFFAMKSDAQQLIGDAQQFIGKDLPDGSTAPNFTFTDMSGTSRTLYTYLNAGKPVVLDISATW